MDPKFDVTKHLENRVVLKKSKKRVFKGKPVKISQGPELDYYKFLRFMVEQIKERFLNIAVEGMDTVAVSEVIHDESVASKLNRYLREIRGKINGQFDKERMIKVIAGIIGRTDREHRSKYVTMMQYGFGIDIAKLPEFKAYKQFINMAIKKNLAEITSLKQETLNKLERSLRTSIQKGKSIPQVREDIIHNSGVTKKKATMIAREEIKNVTVMLTKKRFQNVDINMVEWLTSEDERVRGNPSGRYPNVRPSHYVMDHKIVRLDDPTVYSDDGIKWKKRTDIMPKDFPGDAIGCRCDMAPFEVLD